MLHYPRHDDAASRRLGAIALAEVGIFIIIAVAVQFLRTDLDWLDASLSFYLLDASATRCRPRTSCSPPRRARCVRGTTSRWIAEAAAPWLLAVVAVRVWWHRLVRDCAGAQQPARVLLQVIQFVPTRAAPALQSLVAA